MKIKGKKHLILLAAAFLVTVLAYLWFSKTPAFIEFSNWSRQNLILFSITLFLIKVLGIVWPPIPGGILTLGAIPIVGWPLAYLIDLAGSVVGCSIAFYLGKRYGLKFLNKIFDQSSLEKIKKLNIRKDREIEAVAVLRILTGSTISEAVCYGAGLLGVKYQNFFIGSTAVHLLFGIPSYYFAGNLFEGKNFIVNGIIVLISIPIILKLRKRYLE